LDANPRTAADLVDHDGGLLGEQQPSVEDLLRLVAQMQYDWALLNEYLNTTARYYAWCSTYEERLARYNANFAVMSLTGRAESFHRGTMTNRDPYQLSEAVLKALADQFGYRENHRTVQFRPSGGGWVVMRDA